ncbi:replicative DNA helicase [Paenibacillus sp. JQZ6Y-1]
MHDYSNLVAELPHNATAEYAVIGAMLLPDQPEVASTILESGLKIDAFYLHESQQLFGIMFRLIEQGKPVDIPTVAGELKNVGLIENIPPSRLSKIAGSVGSIANLEWHIRILKEQLARRQTIANAQQQMKAAMEGEELHTLAVLAQEQAAQLSDQTAKDSGFEPIRQIVMDVWDNMETRANHKGEMLGVPSGFVDLDRMTAGFQKSDLIIVAARPSVGKTAFALNIAQNTAREKNKNVGIFSLEMSKQQLVQRMMNAEGNINASRVRTGELSEEDWGKAMMAATTLGDARIFIDDTPGMNVYEICAKARKLKREHGLDMLLIDYLQLIAGRGKAGENRQQEVSEISRMLKQLARELNIPIIALSQLSRGVEQRQDKRPMMSDLRESGAIEQDADIIMFLYRDDYYNAETEKKNVIEIIIGKQRNGPIGTVELIFLKDFNKFVNYERVQADVFAG